MANFSPIRRQDRLLSEKRISELLENGEYGFLSLGIDNNGYAYGIPISFVYDQAQHALYFHCAPEGHKMEILKKNQDVSFCIVGNTCPIPGQFTTLYESVILFGKADIHLDDEEKRAALRKLVEKYCPEYKETGEKYIEKSFQRTHTIKLSIEHITGKSKPGK